MCVLLVVYWKPSVSSSCSAPDCEEFAHKRNKAYVYLWCKHVRSIWHICDERWGGKSYRPWARVSFCSRGNAWQLVSTWELLGRFYHCHPSKVAVALPVFSVCETRNAWSCLQVSELKYLVSTCLPQEMLPAAADMSALGLISLFHTSVKPWMLELDPLI